MNKYLNNQYLGNSISEKHNYNFFGRGGYDRDNERYSRERSRRDAPRRSPNDWEPDYRASNKKRHLKDPKGSSRFVLQLVKRVSEVLLVLTIISLVVATLGYVLLAALSSAQITKMQEYYFTDIIGVSWVFGSIVGIATGASYLILYFLMIFNRKGWLRKNSVKSYFFWFLTFIIVSALSVYFLFVSSSGQWMSITGKTLTYKSKEVQQVVATITNVVKEANSSLINKFVSVFYTNAIGAIATGLISMAGFIIAAFTGFAYYRSINEVLENSYEYFDNRRRRW